MPLYWTHKYQETVEEILELGPVDEPVPAGGATLNQQAQRERLAKLEALAEQLERTHSVVRRWQPGDEEYVRAQRERKRHHVARLQDSVIGQRIRFFAVKARANAAANRRVRFGKRQRLRRALAALEKLLRELQRWQVAPGDPVACNASMLLVADMENEDVVLPWEALAAAGVPSKLDRKVTALREERKRCTEELELLRREVRDVVHFHERRLEALRSAREHIAGSNPDGDVTVAGYASVPPPRLRAAWEKGAAYVLDAAIGTCERRLNFARDARAKMEEGEVPPEGSSTGSADTSGSVRRAGGRARVACAGVRGERK